MISAAFFLPPPNITRLVFENCGFTLTWERYTQRDILTAGYQVKLVSVKRGSDKVTNVSSDTQSYTFSSDLIPNSVYAVSVRAITNVGYSNWTENQLKASAGNFCIIFVRSFIHAFSHSLIIRKNTFIAEPREVWGREACVRY